MGDKRRMTDQPRHVWDFARSWGEEKGLKCSPPLPFFFAHPSTQHNDEQQLSSARLQCGRPGTC